MEALQAFSTPSIFPSVSENYKEIWNSNFYPNGNTVLENSPHTLQAANSDITFRNFGKDLGAFPLSIQPQVRFWPNPIIIPVSTEFCTNLYSSTPTTIPCNTQEQQFNMFPFMSQLPNESSVQLIQPPVCQSPASSSSPSRDLSQYIRNNKFKDPDGIGTVDTLQEFFDIQEPQMGNSFQTTNEASSRIVPPYYGRYPTWTENFTSFEHPLDREWIIDSPNANYGMSAIHSTPRTFNADYMSSQPQPQTHQKPKPNQPNLVSHINTSSGKPEATKRRMRWTAELDKRFVDAVNKLGGGDSATPKEIVKLMAVEGITISQVKSHLQKYRDILYIQQKVEAGKTGKRGTSLDASPSLDLKTGMQITEALTMQMDVQKKLHELVEAQRKFQVQIEVRMKQVERMLQKQLEEREKTSKLINSRSFSAHDCGNPSISPPIDQHSDVSLNPKL